MATPIDEITKVPSNSQVIRILNQVIKRYNSLGNLYQYKGSVQTYDDLLAIQNPAIGDVYNVEDTGDNYAWDGSKWDKLAGTVDLSSYLTTNNASQTYLAKTEASSIYLTQSAAASTYQPIGNYLTTAGGTLTGNLTAPTFIGNLTGTASEATHAASADTATSATSATSATTATSAGKLTTPVTIGISGAVTGTATSFDGSANITINATAAKDSSKIALSGSRGKLAGYETVTSTGAVTVNDSSGDDIVASGAVTVAALSSGTQCWTKTVLLTAASPTVTLGSGWSWVGSDSAPTFSQNGMLVLARRGNKGIANFLSAGA